MPLKKFILLFDFQGTLAANCVVALRNGYCFQVPPRCWDRLFCFRLCKAFNISEHVLPLFAMSDWFLRGSGDSEACGTAPTNLNKLSITLKAFPDTDVCQHSQASANWMSAFLVFSVSPQCLLNSWGIYQKCHLSRNVLYSMPLSLYFFTESIELDTLLDYVLHTRRNTECWKEITCELPQLVGDSQSWHSLQSF